jgi:hypothetical protein
VQARPFQIRKEPPWGRFHFFTLFWGHAVFANSLVFDELYGKNVRGLEKMDLLIHRSGAPAKDIFQMVPAEMTQGGLGVGKNTRKSICRKCGNRKYEYHNKGVMQYRRNPVMGHADFLFTQEWFGTGRKDAWREILVSQKVALVVIQEGWKGIRFKAVELV